MSFSGFATNPNYSLTGVLAMFTIRLKLSRSDEAESKFDCCFFASMSAGINKKQVLGTADLAAEGLWI
jgi:hypothetical protein